MTVGIYIQLVFVVFWVVYHSFKARQDERGLTSMPGDLEDSISLSPFLMRGLSLSAEKKRGQPAEGGRLPREKCWPAPRRTSSRRPSGVTGENAARPKDSPHRPLHVVFDGNYSCHRCISLVFTTKGTKIHGGKYKNFHFVLLRERHGEESFGFSNRAHKRLLAAVEDDAAQKNQNEAKAIQ